VTRFSGTALPTASRANLRPSYTVQNIFVNSCLTAQDVVRHDHRNLSTRTSMFKLLLQTFWAKKPLVKSLLFSTLDKVIYNIVTFLQGPTKPLFTTQNRVEISWKKFAHFFQHARSRSRFLWSRHTKYRINPMLCVSCWWPDWANFRLFGDRLLWVVLCKLRSITNNWATFSMVKVMY
jgi:hypothetical protein